MARAADAAGPGFAAFLSGQAARVAPIQNYGADDMRQIKLSMIVLAALLALAMVGLSGCNTVEGFGKDVQKGGEAIEGAADRD